MSFSLLPRTYSSEDKLLFDKLRQSEFFSDLSDRELSQLGPLFYPRTYHENEALFFLGDPAQTLYFIESGEVELFIDAGQREEVLQRKGGGEIVGTSAFLADTRRLAHCVCRSGEVKLLALATVDLLALYEEHPKLESKLMATLANLQQRWLYRTLEAYRREHGLFELEHLFGG